MCNKEQLIGYVYGELSAAERATFEAHISGCAECRVEVGQLRQTRQHLATWSPPEPDFNFSIVQTRAVTPSTRKRFAFVPQWGLAAAAALLVIAGAAAIANIEMRYGPDGFVVRTGWADPVENPATAPASIPTQAVPATASSEQIEKQLAALAQRLREIEATEKDRIARAAAAVRPSITAPQLRQILNEVEARQRTELNVRMAQVWNDFNAARASDLERVRQIVNKAQGITNYQLTRQAESIDRVELLYRVSAGQQK